jgi:hypothetical protein
MRLSSPAFVSALLVSIAALAIIPAATCSADDVVLLHTTDASPRLQAVARELFGGEYEKQRAYCATPQGMSGKRSCPESWRDVTVEKDIAKGEGHVNDDGEPALFFVQEDSGYCGTRGCSFTVVQQQGNGWRTLLEGSAGPLIAHDVAGQFVRILDQTDLGYHRICSEFIYVWNGATYREIFPTDKDKEEDHPVECH